LEGTRSSQEPYGKAPLYRVRGHGLGSERPIVAQARESGDMGECERELHRAGAPQKGPRTMPESFGLSAPLPLAHAIGSRSTARASFLYPTPGF
jgi:hypothetical protein